MSKNECKAQPMLRQELISLNRVQQAEDLIGHRVLVETGAGSFVGILVYSDMCSLTLQRAYQAVFCREDNSVELGRKVHVVIISHVGDAFEFMLPCSSLKFKYFKRG